MTSEREILDAALEACETILAVKHAMMFDVIHDERSLGEVLDRFGIEERGARGIQLLAKQAQDVAQSALILATALDEPEAE